MDSLQISPCGPERSDTVWQLTQIAFAPYSRLDPPSGALRETVAVVRDDLAAGGGAIAEWDGRAIACLRWHIEDRKVFHVRRLAVAPPFQRQGIGRALIAWAESEAVHRGYTSISVGVRTALTSNVSLFRDLGYAVVAEHRHDGYLHPTWLSLHKPLPPPGG
jgi:GNAT superfamily N-acetyltransferase